MMEPNKVKVSYTSYSTWKNCPHQWKLTYLDKSVKSKPSIDTVFGNAMHTVMQKYITTMYSKNIRDADELDLHALLKDEFRREYVEVSKKIGHFATKEDLGEYYLDGVTILDWFKENRKDLFQKKGWELIGVEVPISVPISEEIPNIEFFGKLDIVLHNSVEDSIHITDIKMSKSGWPKFVKDDKNKTSQLVLYKEFFSKSMGVDPDSVEIEFLIFKRQVDENSEWPNMRRRLQRHVPSSGKITRKKVLDDLKEFIILNYDENGNVRSDVERPAISGVESRNCKFCQAKDDYSLCPLENRISTSTKEAE
jgi:hypothetical protein